MYSRKRPDKSFYCNRSFRSRIPAVEEVQFLNDQKFRKTQTRCSGRIAEQRLLTLMPLIITNGYGYL